MKYLETPFAAQNSVAVVHNFGMYPFIQMIDSENKPIGFDVFEIISHNSLNDFIVTLREPRTGKIISFI